MRKETPPEGSIRIYIHTGTLSFGNGAVGPLNRFIEICQLFDVPREWGVYYYDDSMVIPEKDFPVLIELLTEQRMNYRMDSLGEDWKGFLPPVQPAPLVV